MNWPSFFWGVAATVLLDILATLIVCLAASRRFARMSPSYPDPEDNPNT